MTYIWQKLLGIIFGLILMLEVGCARNTPENSFCLIYEPTYTAKEDTEITKQQVDRNNAAYDCLCERDMESCGKTGI